MGSALGRMRTDRAMVAERARGSIRVVSATVRSGNQAAPSVRRVGSTRLA